MFENTQPEHGWTLNVAASTAAALLNGFIENSLINSAPHLGDVSSIFPFRHYHELCTDIRVKVEVPILGFKLPGSGIVKKTIQSFVVPEVKTCEPFLSQLASSDRPIRDLVATVAGLAVGSSVNYSQG